VPVSSIAREEASLNEAWTAFLAHLPTMFLIWLASSAAIFIALLVGFVALSLCTAIFVGGSAGDTTTGIYISMIISYIVQIPLWVLSQLVGVLFVAVPALYYAFGEVVTISEAFRTLFSRPLRYISAGILFSLAILIGSLFGIIPFIGVGLSMPDLRLATGILPSLAIVGGLLVCFIPCILVCLTMPVYINKIFATEMSVLDAFASSFSAIYKSGKGWTFVGIQLLVGICIVITSLCTLGLGALVAVPVGIFYVQHTAYNKGLVS